MLGSVLVCDDDDLIRSIVSQILKRKFYEVHQAACGEEALTIMHEREIDVLLSDIVMPGMDGFELCQRVKSDHRTQRVPVMLLTALSAQTDRNRGIGLGADDFVTKPIRPAYLGARVRNLVRLRTLKRELDDRRLNISARGATGIIEPPAGSLIIVAGSNADRPLCETLEARLDVSTALAKSAHDLFNLAAANDVRAILLDAANFTDFSVEFCVAIQQYRALRRAASLVLSPADDFELGAAILDAGIGDVCGLPIDGDELAFRLTGQLRQAEYQRHLDMSVAEELQAAIRDPLTGLQNRRFLEHCDRALAPLRELQKSPGTVVAFDLDHFKAINDRHGHAAGDAVLKEFARRLEQNARAGDAILRIGGEEFLLVMMGCDPAEAASAAERIRRAVADKPFGIESGALQVTVSIGHAAIGSDESLDQAIARADAALYRAKRGGRNLVMAA